MKRNWLQSELLEFSFHQWKVQCSDRIQAGPLKLKMSGNSKMDLLNGSYMQTLKTPRMINALSKQVYIV